jgi:predicted enzyme related to lactoylglutathione lyase
VACRWTGLIIDANEPRALAEFWCEVLGWSITEEDPEAMEIRGNERGVPAIVFVPVPEAKTVKNRVHIDVNPTDRTRDEEVERILALGARRVDVGQRDVSWEVLADPEGNEFCVLAPRVDPAP